MLQQVDRETNEGIEHAVLAALANYFSNGFCHCQGCLPKCIETEAALGVRATSSLTEAPWDAQVWLADILIAVQGDPDVLHVLRLVRPANIHPVCFQTGRQLGLARLGIEPTHGSAATLRTRGASRLGALDSAKRSIKAASFEDLLLSLGGSSLSPMACTLTLRT